MNYNMQGMAKTNPKLFMMMKSMKVEIKKEHQVLMIDQTTSFKKKGKGKERKLQVEWQTSCHSREEDQSWTKAWNWVLTLQRKWSLEMELPKYLADKKDGKVNKGICDIHVIVVYLTNARSSTWVFDTGSVANICNSK